MLQIECERRDIGAPKHSARFATKTIRRIGEGTQNVIRRLAEDDGAKVGIAGVGAIGLTVAGVIIGAVVALIMLAELFPSYTGAVGAISTNMTEADWGDPTANALSPIFGMLVALGGLFAIVALAFWAYQLRKSA